MKPSVMKLHSRIGIVVAIAMAVFLGGCSLKYTVKEPVTSSIDYGKEDIAPINLTIIDERTGGDSVFLVKFLGIKGSGSDSIDLKIENIEDPIGYFAQQLEKEFRSRRIPVKCAVGKTAAEGLVLKIHRYQIVNIRATGFSPWEACHIFYGTIIAEGQNKPIKAYFYNGKTPWWSMKEIEEPCFNIPISIIIKEVASKINRAVFNLQASDEKIDKLAAEINLELGKDYKDPYQRPFWKVLDLAHTNNPKAMEPLKKYTEDKDEFFKSCALTAIGILGADGQLDFLFEQYHVGTYNQKYMAAKSIGDLGTPEALKVLQNMKNDKAYADEGGLKHCLDLYVP